MDTILTSWSPTYCRIYSGSYSSIDLDLSYDLSLGFNIRADRPSPVLPVADQSVHLATHLRHRISSIDGNNEWTITPRIDLQSSSNIRWSQRPTLDIVVKGRGGSRCWRGTSWRVGTVRHISVCTDRMLTMVLNANQTVYTILTTDTSPPKSSYSDLPPTWTSPPSKTKTPSAAN